MGVEHRFQPRKGIGAAEIRHLTAGAAQAVGELVIGGHLAAVGGDQRNVVRQRPVVANVERAPPGGQGVAKDRHRQLRLARTGSADDTQPEGLAFDAPGPLRQPAGEAGVKRVGFADHRMHFGHQLQHVADHSQRSRRRLAPGPGQLIVKLRIFKVRKVQRDGLVQDLDVDVDRQPRAQQHPQKTLPAKL